MEFPDRIKALRTKLGLTQAEFAKKIGLSAGYVYQLEVGKRAPGESLLVLLDLIEKEAAATITPRSKMREAREAKGWTIKDLAKATGYSIGVLQALEEANGRGSERQIEKIANALGIPLEDLMYGAAPKTIHEAGITGTLGAKPNVIAGPGVGDVRYVPLISFAQAGRMGNYDDAVYDYEAHIAYDVKDSKAFCVTIRGDSMQPIVSEGDVILVYPTHQPRNGDLVLARLTDDAGGDVMCKVYSAKDAGRKVILTSYNPVHPPLEFGREELRWVYPVAQVTKTFLHK